MHFPPMPFAFASGGYCKNVVFQIVVGGTYD
jgi:hypothetical protein